jgi:hypothetical protein
VLLVFCFVLGFFVFAVYLVPSFANVSGLPFFVDRFDLLQRLATNNIGMM